MLGQTLDLFLGPRGMRVDVAVLIAHEVELIGRQCDGLGSKAKEAPHIDNDLHGTTHTVDMRDGADLAVFDVVNRHIKKGGFVQFSLYKAGVLAMVHENVLRVWLLQRVMLINPQERLMFPPTGRGRRMSALAESDCDLVGAITEGDVGAFWRHLQGVTVKGGLRHGFAGVVGVEDGDVVLRAVVPDSRR